MKMINNYLEKRKIDSLIKRVNQKNITKKELIELFKKYIFISQVEKIELLKERIKEIGNKDFYKELIYKIFLTNEFTKEEKEKFLNKLNTENAYNIYESVPEKMIKEMKYIESEKLIDFITETNKKYRVDIKIIKIIEEKMSLNKYLENYKNLNENKVSMYANEKILENIIEKLKEKQLPEDKEVEIWQDLIERLMGEYEIDNNTFYKYLNMLREETVLKPLPLKISTKENFQKIIEFIDKKNLEKREKIILRYKKEINFRKEKLKEEQNKDREILLKKTEERLKEIEDIEYINYNKVAAQILINFMPDVLLYEKELLKNQTLQRILKDTPIPEKDKVMIYIIEEKIYKFLMSLSNIEKNKIYNLKNQIKELLEQIKKLKELEKQEKDIFKYQIENTYFENQIKNINQIIEKIIKKYNYIDWISIIPEDLIYFFKKENQIINLEGILIENYENYILNKELPKEEEIEEIKKKNPKKYKLILENNFEAIEKITKEEIEEFNPNIEKILNHRSNHLITNKILLEEFFQKYNEEEQLKILIEIFKDKKIEIIKDSKFLMNLIKKSIKSFNEDNAIIFLKECKHIEDFFERKRTIKNIRNMV